jgi:type I restriction enzyme, S subunit
MAAAAFPTAALGHVAEVTLGKMIQSNPVDGARTVPYIKARNVRPDRVEVHSLGEMYATPGEVAQLTVQQGDIFVIEGGATAGRAAVVLDEPPQDAIFQNAVHRVRAGDHLDQRFLCYVLAAYPATGWYEAICSAATFKHLTGEKMARLQVPVPPLEVQRRVADMLDVETARIDTLIAQNQRLRNLLGDRFWAEVDQVVHLGLGDVRRFGEHKVWGKHPEHWTTTTLGRAAESMIDGPFGSSLTSGHYTDDGRQVIRLGNIGRAAFKNIDRAFIPEDHYQALKAHTVLAGDLVIGGLGDDASEAPAGRACVVPEAFDEGIVKADCYRVRLRPWLRHDYAAWALSSPSQIAFAGAKARGATRPRLNLALASQLPMPVPPLGEQEEIASHLALQRERLMDLQARLVRQIELLGRRRQALITAAVTGRIDV